MQDAPSAREGIHVACGGDANYAMQIAVTLYSFLKTQPSGVRVILHLLDGGIPEPVKRRIEAVLERARPDAERKWVPVDLKMFEGLYATETLTAATFMRLVLPERLPEVDRILYLDSDILVRNDVREMYDAPLGDDFVAGVQDFATPYTTPFQKLGLGIRPDNPYFNAGAILMNLARFRQAGLAADVFKFVREYPRYHDQDGLNALIQGRWKQLDFRWNLQNNWWLYAGFPESPIRKQLEAGIGRILEDTVIVHFTNIHKPWVSGLRNPFRIEWHDCLARSGWFHPVEFWWWKLQWFRSAARYWVEPRLSRAASG